MSDHKCHAEGCEEPVEPKFLFCKPHWAAVPLEIRKRVLTTYRKGQCRRKNPSKEWVSAARAAVNSLMVTA